MCIWCVSSDCRLFEISLRTHKNTLMHLFTCSSSFLRFQHLYYVDVAYVHIELCVYGWIYLIFRPHLRRSSFSLNPVRLSLSLFCLFAHFSWLWLLLLLLFDCIGRRAHFSASIFRFLVWPMCVCAYCLCSVFFLLCIHLPRIIIICIFIFASQSQHCIECELSTFYACVPLLLFIRYIKWIKFPFFLLLLFFLYIFMCFFTQFTSKVLLSFLIGVYIYSIFHPFVVRIAFVVCCFFGVCVY